MHFLGMDVGSLSCDALLIDDDERIVGWSVVPTGARNVVAIGRAQEEVLRSAGLTEQDVAATVATGYGRARVEGRLAAVTEITCHARGIRAHVPDAQLVVDIGGQDSKAVLLGDGGRVVRFVMNDKCAAGTGRFLEAMARALEVDIDELARLHQGATSELKLSSMCTVFAESEVVSLIGEGAGVPDIVRGLNRSIASRTRALVKRVARDTSGMQVAMSGGVARNAGVVEALQEELGATIVVPPEPDTVGAYGAALIARERWHKGAAQA